MRIGKVAQRTGVSVEAVRYYERLGLIERAPRTSSGYRDFGEDAVRRIGFIQRAQRLGFSLTEIGQLLTLQLDREARAIDVRESASNKLAEVREKIRDLHRIESALETLIASCRGRGSVRECPILNALSEPTP